MPVHDPYAGCPFCSKSIQSSVFYENRDFMAVFNIAPVLPGHSLVIPRAHRISILSFTDAEMTDFFKIAKTALLILMKAFNTEAFDWSLQEKPEAGQTIEHLHLHIVPRVKNDLLHPGHWYPLVQRNDTDMIDSMNRPRLTAEELKIIVDKLKEVARNTV
jgi:bis(5'-adenosyl)-triphosphatase